MSNWLLVDGFSLAYRCFFALLILLAAVLRAAEPASISQYVRRFRLRGGLGERSFKQALSRFNP